MRWIIRARQIIIWKRNGFNFLMNNPPDLSHLVISQFWRILKMDYPSPVWKLPWMMRKWKDIQMPGWPQRSELNSFLQAWSTYWCNCFSLLDGILVHSVVTPGEGFRGPQQPFFFNKISLRRRTYHLKQAHITCSGEATPVLRFSGADVFITGGCAHKQGINCSWSTFSKNIESC